MGSSSSSSPLECSDPPSPPLAQRPPSERTDAGRSVTRLAVAGVEPHLSATHYLRAGAPAHDAGRVRAASPPLHSAHRRLPDWIWLRGSRALDTGRPKRGDFRGVVPSRWALGLPVTGHPHFGGA